MLELTIPREYGVDLFLRASERFELLRMALIDGRWFGRRMAQVRA